jgi:hypothetical protein
MKRPGGLTVNSKIWTNLNNEPCWSIMSAIVDSLADVALKVHARFAAWFERYFLAPAHPAGLAICRIGFYGYLLYRVATHSLVLWAQAPPGLWKPVLLFRWLPGPIQSPEVLLVCQALLLIALACCVLGVWMRYAAPAAFVLGTLYLGLPQCYGKAAHNETLGVLVLGVLAISYSADALSLTAWRRGRLAPASGEYRWPLALVQTLMCVIFFAAGVAKLRASGLAWIFSDNMQNTLIRNHYTGHEPPITIGLWVARYPALCQALAGVSLLAECAAPLALFSRRLRWLIVPALLGMQVGIYVTMGLLFGYYWVCYLFWIPWSELVERFVGSRQEHQSADVALPTALRPAA